jgi:hypothetical protein
MELLFICIELVPCLNSRAIFRTSVLLQAGQAKLLSGTDPTDRRRACGRFASGMGFTEKREGSWPTWRDGRGGGCAEKSPLTALAGHQVVVPSCCTWSCGPSVPLAAMSRSCAGVKGPHSFPPIQARNFTWGLLMPRPPFSARHPTYGPPECQAWWTPMP